MANSRNVRHAGHRQLQLGAELGTPEPSPMESEQPSISEGFDLLSTSAPSVMPTAADAGDGVGSGESEPPTMLGDGDDTDTAAPSSADIDSLEPTIVDGFDTESPTSSLAPTAMDDFDGNEATTTPSPTPLDSTTENGDSDSAAPTVAPTVAPTPGSFEVYTDFPTSKPISSYTKPPHAKPTNEPTEEYVPPDDDPVKKEDADEKSTDEWDEEDYETLEEMEKDRNVLIALGVVFGFGLILTLITAHQMLENPEDVVRVYAAFSWPAPARSCVASASHAE
eukprot:CAMPEP_0119561676 /NCGR_PEP_ID=MMETSP1352-20130426/18322_1 /TAXON_ID=265584 /ORGANISM="Stauroneis constricta, Strain CCMP1120" /LENGTH=279 /DNA_ID=CAMNT_0007609929 /DNA_START=211 /DNA_END=1051 /DNA_ORIENTATION=+